jgi:hypothetical protein
MQELHEPSIGRVLSKASKAFMSIEGTTLPNDVKLESSDVMTVHSNWRTPFMIYHKMGACLKIRTNRKDLGD